MFVVYNKLKAEQDILKAASWYEEQQPGLGKRFLDDLESLYYYLEINPRLFPEKHAGVRQALMKKFPYVVLYKIYQEQVVVLAVFNCYQHPKKKKARLK